MELGRCEKDTDDMIIMQLTLDLKSPYQYKLVEQCGHYMRNFSPLRFDGHLFRVLSVVRDGYSVSVTLEELP